MTDGLHKLVPFPIPDEDQVVLKRAARNVAEARKSGNSSRESAAVQVLNHVLNDLRERIGVWVAM